MNIAVTPSPDTAARHDLTAGAFHLARTVLASPHSPDANAAACNVLDYSSSRSDVLLVSRTRTLIWAAGGDIPEPPSAPPVRLQDDDNRGDQMLGRLLLATAATALAIVLWLGLPG